MPALQRFDSYDDAKTYHLHRTIQRDLRSLLSEPYQNDSDENSLDLNDLGAPLPIHRFCQVQFKHVFRYYKVPDSLSDVQVGEFVTVQSSIDKSHEDLGVVTCIYTSDEFNCFVMKQGTFDEDPDEFKLGKIFRRPSAEELALLPLKHRREPFILRTCQNFLYRTQIPMVIHACEFQMDGKVLHVYYKSMERVDYRPLVKYVVKKYLPGTRIVMKQTNNCRKFVPIQSAAEALKTGRQTVVKSETSAFTVYSCK